MVMYTKLTLSNSCTCVDEHDAPLDCGGDCFRDDASLVADETAAWVARTPAPYGYLIEGSGMGWTRGVGERDWDGVEPLYEAIGVNSEWQQGYVFDDAGEIRITQSHHDAMGEQYTVRAKRADEA
jgi:hypothetical protein